jgi:hypothetical protein
MDPHLSNKELQQLIFNFSSLQVYGVLLTLTALFLAHRRIWYDSTLLVVLESSLVLVPFILVSQAVSLSKGVAHLMCGLTTLFAAINYSVLKKYYPRLNLPSVLLFFGAIIAVVNGALPLLFKSMQETGNAAMTLDVQEAAIKLALTGILPMLAVLAVFLPQSNQAGDLPPQKRWLPLLVHFLWITATGVHFYSIQYVYRTPFQVSFFAPTVWVLVWVLAYRMRDSLSTVGVGIQNALLILPAIIALPMVWPGRTELNGYLLFCNFVLYALVYFRERASRVALQLALFSLAAVIAEAPKEFWETVWARFNTGSWVLICITVYAVLAAMVSRDPRLGLLGAVCAGWAAVLLFRRSDVVVPIALQVGFGFALLHSIGWKDAEHRGAQATRAITAVWWALHSLSWVQSNSRLSFLVPTTVAAVVVAGYFAFGLLGNIWASRMILLASTIVLISTPVNYFIEKIKTASPGILAVIGSFVLFAVGTWFALSKSKWFKERPHDCRMESTPENPLE